MKAPSTPAWSERSGEHLVWLYFMSPAWTWELGRAGVVAFCDVHERQVAYLEHVMS